MTITHRAVCAALLAASFVGADVPVGAQSAVNEPVIRLEPGTRIRLRFSPREHLDGHLASLAADVFTVTTDENRVVRIPRWEVSHVYMSRSKGRRVWRNAIGMALVGGVLGGLERPTAGPGCIVDCYTRGENIAYTAIGFGVVGGMVGALARSDRWTEIPMDRLR